MNVSFNEISNEIATFYTTGVASAGCLCRIHSNNTIKPCSDGDPIHGKVTQCLNGIGSVIYRGFITAKYTGTAPTLGYCPLIAHGSTFVKVAEGAREYLVVSVDTTTKEICILL